MAANKTIQAIGALLLAMFLLPAAAAAAVDAETVVEGKCTGCHSADRIRETKKSKEDWKILVNEEMDRGAQLSRAEQVAVVDWLAEKYGAAEGAQIEVAETEPDPPAATAAPSTPQELTGGDESLPFNKQAETGVEMWQFLFTGGALLAGGAWMRRR